MKHLFARMGRYKKESVLGPLFKLLEAGFDLCVPLVVAALIDQGIEQGSAPTVWGCVGLLALLAIVGLLAAVTAQWFAARASVGVATGLRQSLFDKIMSLSFSQIDSLGTSTLLTRTTSDVGQVQTGVNLFLRLFLRSPFIVFGAMAMAFAVGGELAWIFVGAIVLLSVVVFGIMLLSIPLYQKVQKRMDAVTGGVRQTLGGVRVVRAFGREEEEIASFGEKNDALAALQQFVGRISALLNPLTYVIINAAVILLLHFCSVRVELGTLTQGQTVALYNYISQILVELVKLANLIITLTRSAACMRRVGAILDMEPDMAQGETRPDEDAEFRVEFDHVSLTYGEGGDETLTDVSFRVRPGETVGIIGGTGSGKSSLVHLIPRFYDATGGRILVDGVDVKEQDTAALRRRVGIVMQKSVLFSGTVRENLLFGNENATDGELLEALRAAQAAGVVVDKGGLGARVEQSGRNFSGGQKQRLTVARALVRRPEILILDDASSALDFATDAALRRAIRELSYKPTVFVVSQRTSSLRHADRILVLDDGLLVGQGTHEELLASCEVYREIHESQYRKEDGEEGVNHG